MKVGQKVLIRADNGQFTIEGVIVLRAGRSSEVRYSHGGKEYTGKFANYDLKTR